MIERIFKNPKTTLLGLIIITLCFALVFLEKATLTEVSVFMLGAFSVLFLKDGTDGSEAKKSNGK